MEYCAIGKYLPLLMSERQIVRRSVVVIVVARSLRFLVMVKTTVQQSKQDLIQWKVLLLAFYLKKKKKIRRRRRWSKTKNKMQNMCLFSFSFLCYELFEWFLFLYHLWLYRNSVWPNVIQVNKCSNSSSAVKVSF